MNIVPQRIALVAALALVGMLVAVVAWTQQKAPALARSSSPGDAVVYIISPANGAIVSSPFKVVFGLSGMGIAPAGIKMPDTGHHHLIVDASLPDLDVAVPSSHHYRHFGKGQTETVVDLQAGKHTLQLLLGDWLHIPHVPPVSSQKITVTVR